MTDIRQWLNSLKLSQYADAFENNAIDWSTLPKLNHELLKEIGVKAVGHRVVILEAIQNLPEEITADSLDQPTRGEAERRQLTVMFCDLVGSTVLAGNLDPEDYRKIITAYQSAVKKPVEKYDGYIARYMGDGVLVYFGFPQAHEDDAERAVRAGLGIIEAVRELACDVAVQLQARIGIATGTVVVGDIIGEGASEERAVLGGTPNLAARLQGVASANSVVISESTRNLVENRFELGRLGPLSLKGISERVVAYRATDVKETSRFDAVSAERLGPLFGRDEELGMLRRRWELAKAGEGQVVLLGGEPGIGKSRLAAALRQNANPDKSSLFSYQCSPYHVNSAFYPIIVQIEQAGGLDKSDDDFEKLDKLEKQFAGNALEQALLAELLSLPTDRYDVVQLTAEKRKSETISLLVKQISILSCASPILVILEDAHWIDNSTREFFDALMEESAQMPVLIVVTHRPEFESPWITKGHATQLILSRLGRGDVRSLIQSISGNKGLPKEVLQTILQKTDGIPLFVEELTKSVIESTTIAKAASHESELTIPKSIHDSLVARLDRLGMAKQVAQIGATIGREFPYGLIAAASDKTEQVLNEGLEQLEESGLVFRRGSPPDATYVFKHALVRDAAYTTMLRERQRALHQRVADAMQQHYVSVAQTQPELLAHHLTEAGKLEAALDHWLSAGRLAFSRSAAAEAQAHLEKGRSLIESNSSHVDAAQRELDFCIALGPVYMTTKGAFAEEVEQIYTRARELSEVTGDQSAQFRVLWGLWHVKQVSGALNVSTQLAKECLSLSTQLQDEGCELQAHHASWSTLFFRGEFDASLQHTSHGWKLYDADAHADHRFTYGGHDPGACSRYFAGMSHWFLGHPEQSKACSTQALELVRTIDHPFSLMVTLLYSAYGAYFRREPSVALTLTQEGLDICDNLGFPSWQPGLAQLRDWAMAVGDSDTDALTRMSERISRERVAGQLLPGNVLFLADACAHLGNYKQGIQTVATGLKIAEELGQKWIIAEFHRLKAVLMACHGATDFNAVQHELNLSLQSARRQNAKSVELRSATVLAQIYNQAGDPQAAQNLLKPVYSAFTEGFDTTDLIDAKNVLDEASSENPRD
ncbi:MAG: adenylate/guanylate cyclase domain-containing protein [Arenicellales bacterium]|nr:adenylate/guanylate cyclase domain-containing protein [Arenicellales bacterium]